METGYTEMVVDVGSAKARNRAMDRLNEAVANLEVAQARQHKAECELGTARIELAKAFGAYDQALSDLHKLLPQSSDDSIGEK